MKHAFLVTLAASFLALASIVHAQTPSSAPAKTATPAPAAPAKKAEPAPTPATPAKTAPATAPSAPPNPEVQKMATDFGKQRDDRLDQRKALLDRLQAAKTDEEKQRILAELRQQQQARIEQQRELARQIREQMQNKRGDTRPAITGP